MATLVKDPISGTFYSNGDPGGTGRTMVDLNGGVASPSTAAADQSTATANPGTDPYTIFNRNIASILTQIQKAQVSGNQNLGGAKDALTTASVTSAPYDPTITPAGNIATIGSMPGAFAPAVTSIATQQANTGAALGNLKDSLSTMASIFQPTALPAGASTVTPQGQVVHQGHSYTPTLNPTTGLMDGFDQNTGTWQSNDKGTGSGSSVVGGVDFSGAATSTGAYATDPKYASEVGGIYKTLTSTFPSPSADTIDTYIKGHASRSPVTGQMIMNASSQYNIDPNLLTSVLAHESDFGTAGAATTTYNPGNVGNTDNGSTRTFKSWQQGVNAAANELARRAVPASAAASATSAAPTPDATSPVGGTFNDTATQKINQIPKAYQNYVDAGPLGVAYVNDDRVPANVKDGLKTMASRAGIPYVQAADVGALKSIEAVLGNLDSMQTLANNNLAGGVLGHIWDLTAGQGAQALQTQHGIQLGLFDNYRDTAIKAVQALAGGAGSGLRINGAEIAANTQNLPTATDSKENAIAQIKQLRQLIYTQLGTTFPYAPVKVEDANGQTGTIPAGNLNAAIDKGYKVI